MISILERTMTSIAKIEALMIFLLKHKMTSIAKIEALMQSKRSQQNEKYEQQETQMTLLEISFFF